LDRFALTDRVAAVTGASEGIGRDIALGLAGAGADVVICSRREGALREAKAEIEKLGRRAEVCALDVRELGDLHRLKDLLLQRFGKLDILVNSAGFTVTKDAWDVDENEWDRMVDTGFKGLFFAATSRWRSHSTRRATSRSATAAASHWRRGSAGSSRCACSR
jgi:2-deoxy-D-gluconate 3-dehydrogenase